MRLVWKPLDCDTCDGSGIDLMDGEWHLGEREFACPECLGLGQYVEVDDDD